jgi:peptidoglycan/LPS O-acetylase OafA/YrhL
MQPAAHRANNFDFVRIVAALCVLVSHQFALNGLREPDLLHIHSLGGVGVLVFFSISGYLVAQSWRADPHLLRFAARRLLRIWPGLALAVILCAVVLGPMVSSLGFADYFRHPFFGDYFRNLRFDLRDELPLRFEGNALPTAVNGSLWTIPMELKCYAVLAVLGVAGLLRSRWIVALLTLVVLTTYAIAQPRGDWLVGFLQAGVEQQLFLEFGLFFFAGVILFMFGSVDTKRRARWCVGACWALAALAMIAGRPLLALWLALPASVLAFGRSSLPYLRRAGRFGDMSYGLYIYAFPVQQTMIWLYKDKLPWGAVLALTVLSTFALAFASWHLVEKTALRLKPKRTSRSSTVAMTAEAKA